jgi:hypothetical protein
MIPSFTRSINSWFSKIPTVKIPTIPQLLAQKKDKEGTKEVPVFFKIDPALYRNAWKYGAAAVCAMGALAFLAFSIRKFSTSSNTTLPDLTGDHSVTTLTDTNTLRNIADKMLPTAPGTTTANAPSAGISILEEAKEFKNKKLYEQAFGGFWAIAKKKGAGESLLFIEELIDIFQEKKALNKQKQIDLIVEKLTFMQKTAASLTPDDLVTPTPCSNDTEYLDEYLGQLQKEGSESIKHSLASDKEARDSLFQFLKKHPLSIVIKSRDQLPLIGDLEKVNNEEFQLNEGLRQADSFDKNLTASIEQFIQKKPTLDQLFQLAALFEKGEKAEWVEMLYEQIFQKVESDSHDELSAKIAVYKNATDYQAGLALALKRSEKQGYENRAYTYFKELKELQEQIPAESTPLLHAFVEKRLIKLLGQLYVRTLDDKDNLIALLTKKSIREIQNGIKKFDLVYLADLINSHVVEEEKVNSLFPEALYKAGISERRSWFCWATAGYPPLYMQDLICGEPNKDHSYICQLFSLQPRLIRWITGCSWPPSIEKLVDEKLRKEIAFTKEDLAKNFKNFGKNEASVKLTHRAIEVSELGVAQAKDMLVEALEKHLFAEQNPSWFYGKNLDSSMVEKLAEEILSQGKQLKTLDEKSVKELLEEIADMTLGVAGPFEQLKASDGTYRRLFNLACIFKINEAEMNQAGAAASPAVVNATDLWPRLPEGAAKDTPLSELFKKAKEQCFDLAIMLAPEYEKSTLQKEYSNL